MATDAYDWARDERLAWIERENDVARGLTGYTDGELRRVHRVSERLLHERGIETQEDQGGRMLGLALISVLVFLFGCVVGPLLVETLAWVVV